MSKVQLAILIVLGLALAISVVTDLKSRKIKDVVTYPTMVLCLGLRLAAEGWGGWTSPGLASGLLGLAIGAGFFLIPFLAGGMGFGDVKLMAAVGAAVGFPLIIVCTICIGLAGGVLAVLVLLWNGRFLSTFGGMLRSVARALRLVGKEEAQRERTKIPYGVAIALGTVWGLVWTWLQVGPGTPH